MPIPSVLRGSMIVGSVWVPRLGATVGASVVLALSSCAVWASRDCASKATCVDRSPGGENDASSSPNAVTPPGDATPVTPADAGPESGELDVAMRSQDVGGQDAAYLDIAAVRGPDAGGPDATADGQGEGAVDSGGDVPRPDGVAAAGDSAPDAGSLAVDLVADYRFDETSGTTCADSSGNGHAGITKGATFVPGLRGNAVRMDGTGQYLSLPSGIVSGLTSFSASAWINLRTLGRNARIFDFGSGTTVTMFLTPFGNLGTTRFTIAVGGQTADDVIDAPTSLPTGTWQQVVVTQTGSTATLYVNGVQIAQNKAMTLNPASLGVTPQNWLGLSEWPADAYLDGMIDNFRIYGRALSASEVLQLFQQQL